MEGLKGVFKPRVRVTVESLDVPTQPPRVFDDYWMSSLVHEVGEEGQARMELKIWTGCEEWEAFQAD